jgi:hypothetical protein
MNQNFDMATVLSPHPDPVDQVSACIRSSAGLPDPGELARCILTAISRLPGVCAAAVGADPAGTALFDFSNHARGEVWLASTRNREPSLVALEGHWGDFSTVWAATGAPENKVYEGTGGVPGGEPWTLAGWSGKTPDCKAWMTVPISVHGEVKFALVLGLDDEAAATSELRDHLARLADLLLPVAAVWAEAIDLNSRLRRVD